MCVRWALLVCLSLGLCGCGDDDSPPADASTDTATDTDAPGDAATDGADGSDGGGDPLVVPTEAGPVRGVLEDDLRIFRGIPYAAPPLGDLRFRRPTDPLPFDGTFEASDFGPVCPQLGRDNLLTPSDTFEGDEDCLTLNVWAHESGRARPVMVFIHGGGFQIGSGVQATYEGSDLARATDHLVVTLNYRLGTLGLLATEDLVDEDADGSAGNYAIFDQIAALEWVRDNIAAFGGDPNNVTIFGESAGGVSVCMLLGSPLAEGLFVRGIIESGGGCYGWPQLRVAPEGRSSAMEVGTAIVEAAGCAGEPDEIACMRSLSPEALVRAGAEGPTSPLGAGLTDFFPNVDGVVLIADTYDRFRTGAVDFPLIIGSNADEATIFLVGVVILTERAYRNRARTLLGPVLGDQVLTIYPASDFASPRQAFVTAFGELVFVCPALAMAQAAAGGSEPAYSYHFTRTLPGLLAPFGAFHGLELAYVFGNYPESYTPSAEDLVIRDLMQSRWGSFARGEAPWAAYERDAPQIFLIDEPSDTVDEIVAGRCADLQAVGAIPTP
jgi:para-nitrobenzyl esterase